MFFSDSSSFWISRISCALTFCMVFLRKKSFCYYKMRDPLVWRGPTSSFPNPLDRMAVVLSSLMAELLSRSSIEDERWSGAKVLRFDYITELSCPAFGEVGFTLDFLSSDACEASLSRAVPLFLFESKGERGDFLFTDSRRLFYFLSY